ncbi:5-methyltetrahydrofolate--homocysteine methyltransferase [Desulfatibacillum alkenivorans DSM 16219]|uniref:5-methyltetrahydrofolate--homocysteine methyltransferase n=1 Tax=Desulfatibacillum alkenivorans DSM 16219 TaxID=1121393 RepID=A0A1M6L1T0_9BACT|nr:dihydropteroate synthase [Desulfatibacillum alkenivorans]SHJ65128.1 5-methyltetrahydrofolate--homocysteine methyltransferase [Desulfatibacillum alkenivorans DSM 16219]
MIIVGELLNASRPAVKNAIEKQDEKFVADLAKAQEKAGAHYIDVNAGVFPEQEPKYLSWLVKVVQEATNLPCALDSPNPQAIKAAMEVHQGAPLVNSISLEKTRWDSLLPLAANNPCKLVALCTSDQGMPKSREQRVEIAERMVCGLLQAGMNADDIYVDPLVQPVATDAGFGEQFLLAMGDILNLFPSVHAMCGLSNISYGLPVRKLLNRTFMILAIGRGLDGAIINPLDKEMMAAIAAAETLVGKDGFCMNYLKAFRAGALEPSLAGQTGADL